MRKLLISWAICSTLMWVGVLVPLSASALGNTLTVYTYDSFVSSWGPGTRIEQEFERTCECDLELVGLADGVALLNRLRLEGTSSRADLILGIDNNLMAEAAESGLFEPHGIDISGLSLPIPWCDQVFVPYDYGYFALVYDRQQIGNPPTSLRELIEGHSDDGQTIRDIVIQDPRSSTPGLGLLLWIKAVYADRSYQAWRQLSKRVLTVTPGWSESYSMFVSGEVPMVISYTTSPAYHLTVEQSDRYAATVFAEGNYMQVEVAGLLAHSDNKALARRFLVFMLSPGFQDHIPTGNWMLPAGRVSAALPRAFEQILYPARTLILDSALVQEHRRSWTDEWLAAMSGWER